ncbi:hypothetical protein V4C85_00810 [Ralstonia solanacearum]
MREVIDFLKEKGGFKSDPLLARAAGINPRRLEHAIQRGSQLTASEEVALGYAAGINPVHAMRLIETAYDPAREAIWKGFQKLFRAQKLAMGMAS